jgi:hypothetical protein
MNPVVLDPNGCRLQIQFLVVGVHAQRHRRTRRQRGRQQVIRRRALIFATDGARLVGKQPVMTQAHFGPESVHPRSGNNLSICGVQIVLRRRCA